MKIPTVLLRLASKTRKYLLFIPVVPIVASLVGLAMASATPAEVKQESTLLSYRHEGSFDYQVRLKPSHLFGPLPETPPPNPKYPAGAIKTIDFSYTYSPATRVPVTASINALLENPGVWQRTITLLPQAAATGDLSVRFSLDIEGINSQFDNIEKAVNINTMPRTLTIIANLTVAGESITQRLPMKLDRSVVEVDSNLKQVGPSGTGTFDYVVKLKPPTEEPVPNPRYPAEIVGKISFTFSYIPAQPGPVTASVEAVLENPGLWQKTLALVPETSSNGTITLPFSLNIGDVQAMYDAIDSQLKIDTSPRGVTIRANVTDAKGRFVQSLPITLDKSLIEVDSNVKQVGASGTGKFDYTLSLKSPAPPPSPNPKYPTQIVDGIDFQFSYLPEVTEPVMVKIEAIAEDPGVWAKTIQLVPGTAAIGAVTVPFSFSPTGFLLLFDEIDLQLNMKTLARTVTLRASVTGAKGLFVQDLPLKLEAGLIEVDGNLRQSKSLGTGTFGYVVNLKLNSIFDTTTIRSPALPETAPGAGLDIHLQDIPAPKPPSAPDFDVNLKPPPPTEAPAAVVLKPGGSLLAKIVDRMDVTYRYRFISPQPASGVSSNLTITAAIEAPGVWSKSFLLRSSKEGAQFNVSFPLDISAYSELLAAIQSETGASADSYNLTVTATVHVAARTSAGPIDETFTQAMKGTLKGSTLEWDKELTRTQPGSIKQTKVVANNYLGMPVAQAKVLFAVLEGVFCLLFASSLFLYVRTKPAEPPRIEKEIARLQKKYGQRMAAAIDQTPANTDKTISMRSMEDLIKVADELGKPIIHHAPADSQQPHTYYVIDGASCYQYVPSAGGQDQAGND